MGSKRIIKRLVVSYFSYVAIYIIVLYSLLILQLPEDLATQKIVAPIFTVIYLPVIYLLWRSFDVAAFIAAGSMLLVGFLEMLFIFPLIAPFWVSFGLLCLGYALYTGLFEKQEFISASDVENGTRKRIFRFVTSFIALIVLCWGLYITHDLYKYGFEFDNKRTCGDITVLEIPEQLKDETLSLENETYTIDRISAYSCLKDIDYELTPHDPYQEWNLDNDYAVEKLQPGKQFSIKKVVYQSRLRVLAEDTTVPGAMFYYVMLEDENGNVYQVHTQHLGENGIQLSYAKDGKKGILVPEDFKK